MSDTDDAPIVANESATAMNSSHVDTEDEFDDDGARSIDLVCKTEEDDDDEDDDDTDTHLNDVYNACTLHTPDEGRAWTEVSRTHMCVGDVHPLRDDDDADSTDWSACKSAVNRADADATASACCNGSAAQTLNLDNDYNALARRFYRMTPRCDDDAVSDSLYLGASAATVSRSDIANTLNLQHIERLMMARADSNDEDVQATSSSPPSPPPSSSSLRRQSSTVQQQLHADVNLTASSQFDGSADSTSSRNTITARHQRTAYQQQQQPSQMKAGRTQVGRVVRSARTLAFTGGKQIEVILVSECSSSRCKRGITVATDARNGYNGSPARCHERVAVSNTRQQWWHGAGVVCLRVHTPRPCTLRMPVTLRAARTHVDRPDLVGRRARRH
jgi:hypothetical protein